MDQQECDTRHKLLVWVIGIIFVIIGGVSAGASLSLKTVYEQEDRIGTLEGKLDTQVEVQVVEHKYIRESLDRINNKLDKIETHMGGK
jgi:hypothetical protein